MRLSPLAWTSSLYPLFGGIIAAVVIVVLGLHGVQMVTSERVRLVADMERLATASLMRLQKSLAPFVEAYAVHEYDHLVEKEVGLHDDYLAIVVHDANLARVLGQDRYASGYLRMEDGRLVTYDPADTALVHRLEGSFRAASAPILSAGGEAIGEITVYMNDRRLRNQTRAIVVDEIVGTSLVAIILIAVLLAALHWVMLRPLRVVAESLRDVDAHGIPRELPAGTVYREIAPLTDALATMVAEVRRSHEALDEERAHLQSVIDGTLAGTWEYDVQSGAVVFNERWAEIAGYTLEELAPLSIATWVSLTHPDDLAVSDHLLQRHFACELSYYECEVRMRHKDGHWVWVLDRGKVVSWTQDGKPLRVAGTRQDISIRKEAELKLERSELLLRSSIDAISEAFVIYDNEDRLVFCNEQYRQTYPSIADLLTPGTHFETIIRAWAARGALDVGVRNVDEWVAERLAHHRNGTVLIQQTDNGRWVRIVEKRTPDGYTVGFRVDITELVRARQAAEAAVNAKSRFLATMSHEIRTPLNGVLGMAQLLLSGEMSDAERRNCARVIMHSGQTLLALLNDVLDLSKIEAGRLAIERGAVDPGELLAETEALFSTNAQDKGIVLTCRWHGASGRRYEGDSLRLRQMLSNLVSNALKFTDAGSVTVEASETAAENEQTLLRFVVADTGIGISPDQQGRLFQPFSQLDDSRTRQHGGTGLGLSIVKNLAGLMGGEVGVESVPGQGSRFWFTVPAKPLAQNIELRQETRNCSTGTVARYSGRVLVVEDNATSRLVVGQLLKMVGVDVAMAENGRAALDRFEAAEHFDLVLMDVQMPKMDGLSATRALRERGERLPIVALTADAFAEDRAACLAAGMDDFLAKPLSIEALAPVLARWLPGAPAIAAPPAASADGPVLDWPAVMAQIDTLLKLLAENRFEAIDAFAELKMGLAGTPLADVLAKIDPDIQSFRFAAASEALAAIAQTTRTENMA